MPATNATRKRRTEGEATNEGTNGTQAVAPMAPPKSILKLKPKCEPARAAIESLPTEIQDPIANQMDAMLGLYYDVKRKEVGLSKIQPDLTNDTDLITPSCLRTMKNPLSGTKLARGTEYYEQLHAEMDGILETYREAATKVFWKSTKFEVEQLTDKLMSAMHELAYDLANALIIMRMDAQDWNVRLTEEDIAGHAVTRLFELHLPDSFFQRLSLDRERIHTSLVESFLKKKPADIEAPAGDDVEYEDEAIVTQIALSLLNLFPALTLNIWAGQVVNVAKKRVGGKLKEYFATKNQNKANEDVVMALDEEAPGNTATVNELVATGTREHAKKVDARLTQMERMLKRNARLNFSGQEQEGLQFKATGNGPKQSEPSRDGKSVTFAQPSKNGQKKKKQQHQKQPPSDKPKPTEKQREKQRKKKKDARKGNQGASRKDGKHKPDARS